MVDYKNAKVYKIECYVTGFVYVGSTTQRLNKRLAAHKYRYNGWKKSKLNHMYSSFICLANNNYRIVLLEECPCDNREQLLAREAYWIRNTKCVNVVVPGRTLEEYNEQNKDRIRKRTKIYRERHKEKHKAYVSEKITCECGSIVCRGKIARHRRSKKHVRLLESMVVAYRELLKLAGVLDEINKRS